MAAPGSPTGSIGEPLDFGSELPLPRVRSKDVLLYVPEDVSGSEQFFPRVIRLDSPRFSSSMVDTGVVSAKHTQAIRRCFL